LQRYPTALRYPDRLINGLLRRNAPEKGKVGRPNGLWRQKLLRQTMVNGADPPGAGNGPPLGVRNRDHRDRRKVAKTTWCSGRSSRPWSVVTNGVDWREHRENG